MVKNYINGITCYGLLIIVTGILGCSGHKSDNSGNGPDNSSESEVNDRNQSEHQNENTPENDVKRVENNIKKMAVMGDSITVGMLRDTHIGSFVSPAHPLIAAVIAGSKSISELMHDLDEVYRSGTFSHAFGYSTSEPCTSHACQLGLTASEVENLGVSGSRVSDVTESQIAGLKEGTGYIVISAGGNDLCSSGYSPEALREDLQSLMKALEAGTEEGTRVLLVPPPDVSTLPGIAPSGTTAMDTGFATYTCEDIRDGGLFGSPMCPRLFDITSAEYKELITIFNESVSSFSSDHLTIKVADNIAGFIPEARHLSGDCFHPSEQGHRDIGDLTWLQAKDFFWPEE